MRWEFSIQHLHPENRAASMQQGSLKFENTPSSGPQHRHSGIPGLYAQMEAGFDDTLLSISKDGQWANHHRICGEGNEFVISELNVDFASKNPDIMVTADNVGCICESCPSGAANKPLSSRRRRRSPLSRLYPKLNVELPHEFMYYLLRGEWF